MAAKLGYANAEIFPKQNKVDMQKGGTGSFLNLPYHNFELTTRYAIKEDGSAMSLKEFFEAHSKVKLTEDQLINLAIKEETTRSIILVFILKKDFLVRGIEKYLNTMKLTVNHH